MKLEEFLNKKVAEVEGIMIRPGEDFIVKDYDEIRKVATKAQNVDFHAVVQTDEDGKSKKLISAQDVLGVLIKGNELRPDKKLNEVDVGNPKFDKVRNDTTLREVVKEFERSGHKYLIVESDQKPIGAITTQLLSDALDKLSPI